MSGTLVSRILRITITCGIFSPQALKNTGEVEDGEYDWMKLNNGKGWEAMKQHPSQHMLHNQNAVPGASARELHGTARGGNSTPGHLTAARLNAAQPPASIPNQTGDGQIARSTKRPRRAGPKTHERSGGGTPRRRYSPPAQPRPNSRTVRTTSHRECSHSQTCIAQAQNGRPQEPQPTGFQKLMKTLCCGKFSRNSGFTQVAD